jgi:hypothetical protein
MAKLSTKRGAKAPRSAFRGDAKAKAAKPVAKAAKAAKPAKAIAKPVAKPAKPVAKAAKPVATSAAPAMPPPKAAANEKSSSRLDKIAAGATPPAAVTSLPKQAPATGRSALLGAVTAPSGKLAVFDVGLFGFLPRETLEPALIIADVPRDRALPVVGVRVGSGRFAECWDHVAIITGEGKPESSRKLGEAGVDFARLIAIDYAALDAWQHEHTLDGLADFVFWGRDASELARAMNAPPAVEGYGWTNLPIAEAEARADQAGRIKAQHRLLLATDFRPHSHHYRALAAARLAPAQAGMVEVGRTNACLFFTSWGDGVFPIFLDLDSVGRPVQIRVQLQTPASLAAMRAVND